MTRIGLLSDTHAYWDEKYLEYFEPCDEIWHAGDIGSLEVAEKLAAFRPLRAVYGNIDGQEIRKLFPQVNRFTVDHRKSLLITARLWMCRLTSVLSIRLPKRDATA